MFCNSSSTFLLYLCGGLGSAGRLGSGLVNFIAIRRLCCSQVPTPGILSLIIYRTKAESSRETPDFASKWHGFSFIICESRWSHASRFRFASVFRAKKRASSFHCRCSLYVFNYFQRSVPPVHNIVSSLNLCFCWTVPQITFPFNSKNNFRESLLYPFAFNLKQINGSYSASGFLLISSELSYNLNYQASILWILRSTIRLPVLLFLPYP